MRILCMCDFFSCLWQRGYAPQLGLELAKTRMTFSFYLPASISQFCFFFKDYIYFLCSGSRGREREREERQRVDRVVTEYELCR